MICFNALDCFTNDVIDLFLVGIIFVASAAALLGAVAFICACVKAGMKEHGNEDHT